MTLEIRVVADEAALAMAAADRVARALRAAGRTDATLMPALGTSALGVYRELGRRAAEGRLDASRLRLVQLDEYEDVAEDDPRLLHRWLQRDVAGPLAVTDDRIIRLGGGVPGLARSRSTGDAGCRAVGAGSEAASVPAASAQAACLAYDAAVAAAGGVDVAVLGLGPNGHLGFNEPPSGRDAPTRSVALSPESLKSNARYWPGLDVPTRALTAGMTTILAARGIVLVVSGERKRPILRQLLAGRVGPALPASYLRTHPAATLIADDAAWPPDVPRPAHS